MKYAAIVACIVLLVGFTIADDFTGARPLGMGRSFVGVADDANALDWNVAGMTTFEYISLTGSFNKLFLGIEGDNIGVGHIGVVGQYRTLLGYGFSWRNLMSDVFSENHLKLGFSHRFGWKPATFFGKHPLSIGLAFRMDGVGYNEKNFEPGPEQEEYYDDVFKDGTSKMAFSLDAGFVWRYNKFLTIGASACNILQPDLALFSDVDPIITELPPGVTPDDIKNAGKYPMDIRFGVGITPISNTLIAADIQYNTLGDGYITPHFGAERWFYKQMVGIRAGYSTEELTFGLGWRLKKEWIFGFDYAFAYPLTHLNEAGATSHKFSAIFNLPNPVPVWDFTIVSVEPKMIRLKPGDETNVDVTLKNLTSSPAKNVTYSVYSRKPDGTYSLLGTGEILKMKPGEEYTETVKFQDFLPGEYTIFCAADDDGSDIPKISGKVDELDEGNNVGEFSIQIFPAPTPTVTFRQDTLHVTRITFQETEEPVIPIIFFEPKSAEILPRYKRILDKMGSRISINPDVVVRIAGYYDVESDGEGNKDIALKRQDAVYNYLLPKVTNKDQIVKEDVSDLAKKRAGKGKRYVGIERFLPKIRHENRRVELVPEMPKLTAAQKMQTIKFKKGETEKTVDFTKEALTFKQIMERNPDVMLLLEGYATDKEGKSLLETSFLRAANLKEQMNKYIPFYLWARVFAWGEGQYPADQPHVIIRLTPDGVIFKPFPGRKIPKGINVENPGNTINLSVKTDNPIVSYRVELFELGGDKVKTISAGKGEPPASVSWDWKLESGEYIEGGKFYYAKVSATDQIGAVGEALSETLIVDQVDKVFGVESALLVVFSFDKPVALSPYYHSRMEAVAKRIIELGERGGEAVKVVIGGHTDIIGLRRRNQELSEERSNRELKNLRVYLIQLLNIDSEKDLNIWLKDHSIELVSKGFGPDKPYALSKMKDDGTTYEEVIGDNEAPEGRAINRRVGVEYISKVRR
jgi:outer membrane protein OmpA-like peptidoglycan-associated protein